MSQYLVSYQWSQTETVNVLVFANSVSDAKSKVEKTYSGGYGTCGCKKVDKILN